MFATPLIIVLTSWTLVFNDRTKPDVTYYRLAHLIKLRINLKTLK